MSERAGSADKVARLLYRRRHIPAHGRMHARVVRRLPSVRPVNDNPAPLGLRVLQALPVAAMLVAGLLLLAAALAFG